MTLKLTFQEFQLPGGERVQPGSIGYIRMTLSGLSVNMLIPQLMPNQVIE